MKLFEWIFGKDDKVARHEAGHRCLQRVQDAVDQFHRQLTSLCGEKARECGECWNEIPRDSEWLYCKCPNYDERCRLREKMNHLCDEAKKDFDDDLRKSFYECRFFLWRPFFRNYAPKLTLFDVEEDR